MLKKIVHLLYSGLGGHAEYFFNFYIGLLNENSDLKCFPVFFGVEPLRESYIRKCKELGIDYYYVRKNVGVAASAHFKVYKLLKKLQPEVVIIHSNLLIPVSFLYAKCFYSAKLLFVEHQSNDLKRRREWLWTLMSMRLSDYNIYLTERYRSEVERKIGFLFNKPKAKVINSALDIDLYPRYIPKKDCLKVIIGMQGRMVSIKDHTTLIKAILILNEKYPEVSWILRLAGDGVTREGLENIVSELGLESCVEFCGMLGEEDLKDFMLSLDIYVHATFGETMSTAIMQAQAYGLPIIGSDVGGVNNVITHNVNGLLVQVCNDEELANAIYYLKNYDVRKLFSDNSRSYALDNLSINQMIDKYLGFI
ncbi:glycosyltransferase [Limibacter armeniacum]|uniref:glycosyltransferase n=1 Tax=Limibacter armeniacum TaxID=466084 RepID=UPI002FE559D5